MEAVHECPEDGNEQVQRLAAEEHFRRNPGRPEISYVVITKEDVIEAIEKIPNHLRLECSVNIQNSFLLI